jgi:serine/threonine protein phosphatase PrpC
MASVIKSTAVSHVGKVRANNQDSGYAGTQLFIVADGMGGHAGGDVASAIALTRLMDADRVYASASDAEFALKQALAAANSLLAETVFDHPELTGMGTTVSAIMRADGKIALAHIGDSRVYLLRDGKLTQITADHTFVQRLVDSGRITQEEAAIHPRRSVLMRVLGDVDAAPEIDTAIFETEPGDRWMLCSDGLSSYVSDDKIETALKNLSDVVAAADRLVKESLDQGAPDNVTVVIVDIDGSGDSSSVPPIVVGSAAAPLSFESDNGRKPLRLPALLLHPLKSTQQEDSHFEPESDEYLDELILEDRHRARNRRIAWLIGAGLILIGLALALIAGYRWTQSLYYVGPNGSTVAIYEGVQQNLGPIELHSVYEQTSVKLTSLPSYTLKTVTDTISATDLADARSIVDRLRDASK